MTTKANKIEDKGGIDPAWGRNLDRRVLLLVLGGIGGDGHSIFDPNLLVSFGVPEAVVSAYTIEHHSGGSPKEMIFNGGGVVRGVVGVYGLDFMRGLAGSLGVTWRGAMGRGWEARNIAEAVRQWVDENMPRVD